MNRKSLVQMFGVIALGVMVVYGTNTVYNDHVRKTEHDLKVADAEKAAGYLTNLLNHVGEKVPQLPADEHKWNTLVFTQSDQAWPVQAFEQDARLKQLKSQTKFYVYTPASQMYQQRFRPQVADRFPSVFVTREDGVIVSQMIGAGVPRSASEIGDKVAGDIANSKPCPDCHPKPTPPPPGPAPAPIPDNTPVPAQPVDEDKGNLLGLIVGFIGVGVVMSYRSFQTKA